MSFLSHHTRNDHQGMRGLLPSMLSFVLAGVLAAGCNQPKEHTAPAIHDRDSVPIMTTYGVNTLISDSGVIKYRIVTERWEVNTVRRALGDQREPQPLALDLRQGHPADAV